VVVPVLLLLLATLASALLAYGAHPAWARYEHGLVLIMASRHHQWPIAAAAMVLSLAVVALVVAGRRRAWWLIGLAPVLALFTHRFLTNPLRQFTVLDDPPLVQHEAVDFLDDDEYVVGVVFGARAIACPYRALYYAPVVFSTDHDRRMLLMWSALANRASAWTISRELRPGDLEIVSMPANALLIYNARLGQFINGLTGLTPDGQRPTGCVARLHPTRTTWAAWRSAHPATLVMIPPTGRSGPTAPVGPWFAMPPVPPPPPQTPIVLIGTDPPAALPPAAITRQPLHLTLGGVPVVLFRDPRDGQVRAFDRRIDELVPRFRINRDQRRRGAWLLDADSDSGWSADGRAVDGHFAAENRRLTPLPAEEGLYWGVMRAWMRDLVYVDPAAAPP